MARSARVDTDFLSYCEKKILKIMTNFQLPMSNEEISSDIIFYLVLVICYLFVIEN